MRTPALALALCLGFFSIADIHAEEDGASPPAESAPSAHAKPIDTRRNRWILGGGLGLSWGSRDGYGLVVAPRLEYLLTNQISLGGLAVFYQNFTERETAFSAGPAVTVYPYVTPDQVVFLGATYLVRDIYNNRRKRKPDFVLTAGMNFRITSRVGAGPRIDYRPFADDKEDQRTSIGIGVSFYL